MKFSEHLAAHVTPEWHKQYITYEVSAALLYYDIVDMFYKSSCSCCYYYYYDYDSINKQIYVTRNQ